jgi:hypothetical protein
VRRCKLRSLSDEGCLHENLRSIPAIFLPASLCMGSNPYVSALILGKRKQPQQTAPLYQPKWFTSPQYLYLTYAHSLSFNSHHFHTPLNQLPNSNHFILLNSVKPRNISYNYLRKSYPALSEPLRPDRQTCRQKFNSTKTSGSYTSASRNRT